MKLTFTAAQVEQAERSVIFREFPIIAKRLRGDFPETFRSTSDGELLLFSQACAEQALLLGELDEAEQTYQLAAVNANLPRIESDPIGHDYFLSVAGSDSLTGGAKTALLYRNLARFFEGNDEPRKPSDLNTHEE